MITFANSTDAIRHYRALREETVRDIIALTQTIDNNPYCPFNNDRDRDELFRLCQRLTVVDASIATHTDILMRRQTAN